MADNNTIARPYAQAVFEVAMESGTLDEVGDSLAIASALLEDGQVADYLGNPAMSNDDRFAFLTDLFARAGADLFAGGNKHGTNFVKLLLENGRLEVLPEIAARYDQLKSEIEKVVDVVITSAAPLSAAQQSEIATSLKARFGQDVSISTAIDENLIGGAVITAGDVVIDGSLRSSLEGLTNALIN